MAALPALSAVAQLNGGQSADFIADRTENIGERGNAAEAEARHHTSALAHGCENFVGGKNCCHNLFVLIV